MAKAVHDPTAAHHAVAAVGIGAVVGAIAVRTLISAPVRTGGETERKPGAYAEADSTPPPTAAAPLTALPAAVTAPPWTFEPVVSFNFCVIDAILSGT
jgi:hypothetical protein